MTDDSAAGWFELYDLKVEVVAPPGAKIWCGARPGDHFTLEGEMLRLPPGQGFSIYSIAAVVPFLAAKQRVTDPNDWMTTDAEIACPDPNCPSRLRITRTGRRRFRHADTTCRPSPGHPVIPRIEIAPGITLSRLIKGGWHLAGDHGDVDPDQAIGDMAAFVDAGITTFDCADIYTGVEELIGRFRREYPGHAARLRVHTKFVPDLDELASVDRAYVERIVDRSLQRLGMERLDLVQFHWWDHSVARYVEVALELERLRKAGKIDRIGVTNFGMAELGELLGAGVPVLTHQLQYSLLDDRPEHGMVELCRARGIALLAYGTVAGGFLSDRWLGQPSPAEPLGNRSLVKYRLIIDEFGGWPLFQELLAALRQVAERHGCDLATVATRVVLDRPGVAAAIVGATSAAHLAAHTRVGAVKLDRKDQALIEAVTRRREGPPGDVYTLERDREGPHGRIMKYTLNR